MQMPSICWALVQQPPGPSESEPGVYSLYCGREGAMARAEPTVVASRFVGARIARTEDARLLTGRGTFVDDVVRPGMLHAHFVRSPLARARILSIDTSQALALDGVHAVFVAADL